MQFPNFILNAASVRRIQFFFFLAGRAGINCKVILTSFPAGGKCCRIFGLYKVKVLRNLLLLFSALNLFLSLHDSATEGW